ncbi:MULTISPECIES: PDZ domain-containing protein [Bacteroidota]|uniref:PDZ domain-containing protein n=1 Tax=Bacteroidota TaxID=976 RepID=UPI00241D6E86|nr:MULTISPECIES: PDZ domain-containing protein [Bacteroidota]
MTPADPFVGAVTILPNDAFSSFTERAKQLTQPIIAGIKKGDEIFTINGIDVSSAKKINIELSKLYAGDKINISFKRDKQQHNTDLILGILPMRENNHPANKIPGGKSLRRDNFKSVFLHDSRIHSDECGSPVFNWKGDFLGINIARFSHTACLTVPREVIFKFLKEI